MGRPSKAEEAKSKEEETKENGWNGCSPKSTSRAFLWIFWLFLWLLLCVLLRVPSREP